MAHQHFCSNERRVNEQSYEYKSQPIAVAKGIPYATFERSSRVLIGQEGRCPWRCWCLNLEAVLRERFRKIRKREPSVSQDRHGIGYVVSVPVNHDPSRSGFGHVGNVLHR
jgi:hypothetical protein